jgi:hypothetical protein
MQRLKRLFIFTFNNCSLQGGGGKWERADMTEDHSDAEADAKTALLMVQVLILALIEGDVVDGEVFRRIADDALTSDVNVDPAVMTQIILRLNSLIQDTYAAQPVNTSLADGDRPIAGLKFKD